MPMNIETMMETFARTYAKDTGIQIRMGANFCTDGKTIYIVPISDRHDSWIRFMTEVICYHETGHIVTGDAPTFRTIKDSTKRNIFNVVRDVVVEHVMETEYVGLKDKWIEFFGIFLKKNPVEKRDPATLLLNLVYLKGREQLLGVDFGLKVPKATQEVFDKKLAKFVDRICNHTDIKTSMQITEEIFEALKEPSKPPQPKQQPQPQKGKKKDEDSNEKETEEEGSEENENSSDGGDSRGSDGEDSDDVPERPESDGGGHSDDSGEDESGSSSEEDSNGDETGDQTGTSDSGCPTDNEGADSEETSDDGTSGEGSVSDSEDGESGNEELSDDAEKVLEKVQELMEDGLDSKTLSEEAIDQINKYAEANGIYRVEDGLKEEYVRIDQRPGWENEVALYEENGRKMVGFLGGKLKNLFISEHAPIIIRNAYTGRLDTKRLHKVMTGSRNLYCRKTSGVYEDACVYEVIDHSGSMDGTKAFMAQSIMTTVSNDLDKLRIPFGAVGFTTTGDCGSGDEVRRTPCQLNIIKDFDEPYRRVKHRFVWPQDTNGTIELPGIQHAAYQLAARRETKKVLFILTDGETAAGSTRLNNAVRVATKEFIQRLLKAGFKVVGIGIEDTSISYYCPDFIHVKNLDTFASEFYHKLTKLLL